VTDEESGDDNKDELRSGWRGESRRGLCIWLKLLRFYLVTCGLWRHPSPWKRKCITLEGDALWMLYWQLVWCGIWDFSDSGGIMNMFLVEVDYCDSKRCFQLVHDHRSLFWKHSWLCYVAFDIVLQCCWFGIRKGIRLVKNTTPGNQGIRGNPWDCRSSILYRPDAVWLANLGKPGK